MRIFLLVMFQFYNHNNFFLRIQYRQQHLPSPRINNISTMNILDDLDDELDELETTTKPKVKILNKKKEHKPIVDDDLDLDLDDDDFNLPKIKPPTKFKR